MNDNHMQTYQSDTWFDRLPTEIILNIFDYLSSNDILYSFFDLNQRFYDILIQHQHYTQTLELPILNLDYWKQILVTMSSQIQTLIITNDHLSLSLNYFTNLKSLIISSADYFHFNQLKLILESDEFKTLRSLKINCELWLENEKDENYRWRRQYILERILNDENILETFELIKAAPIGAMGIDTLKLNLNLHSLTLEFRFFTVIFDVIPFAPNLKYLNLITETPTVYDKQDRCPNLSYIALKKLSVKLLYTLDELYAGPKIDLNVLIYFIKQFSSSLKYLSLDLSEAPYNDIGDFPFNGIKLQEELLKFMTQLEKFQLYAWVDQRMINNQSSDILSTFQNRFWFDHNWFVGMHESYLYTLPFPSKYLTRFNSFNQIRSSNEEFLINNPCIWCNVTSVQLNKSCKINSNLLELFKVKMPRLTSITVRRGYSPYRQSTTYSDIDENESDNFYVTLDTVTTVNFYSTFIENEKQWLIHALPNLTQLILKYSNLPSPDSQLSLVLGKRIRRLHLILEGYWEDLCEFIEPNYFPNLEHLNITIDLSTPYGWLCECANYVIYLLENLEKLKIFLIDFVEMEPHYTPRGIAKSSDLFKDFHLYAIPNSYEMTHFFQCTKFTRKS